MSVVHDFISCEIMFWNQSASKKKSGFSSISMTKENISNSIFYPMFQSHMFGLSLAVQKSQQEINKYNLKYIYV